MAVAMAFGDARGAHGASLRVAGLRDLGWQVSEKTVADSMRRQGLIARKIRRRRIQTTTTPLIMKSPTTRQSAEKLCLDFGPQTHWCTMLSRVRAYGDDGAGTSNAFVSADAARYAPTRWTMSTTPSCPNAASAAW